VPIGRVGASEASLLKKDKINMIYFSSDLHFGDDRLQLLGRPFSTINEMHSVIIENWNKKVGINDSVYIIGDIAYNQSYLPLLKKLNGELTLIKGNYDKEKDKVYGKYFIDIKDQLALSIKKDNVIENEFYLNHYPSRAMKGTFNLVGHIHATWKVQLNTINVGLDAWHFYPVSYEQIKFTMNAINNFYDRDVWSAYEDANMSYKNKRGKKTTYYEK
jgi:calcineurin-like phosphoesterase family protein